MFLFILVKRKYGKPLTSLEVVIQSSPARRFLSAHNCCAESCGDRKGHRSRNQEIIYATTNISLCKNVLAFFSSAPLPFFSCSQIQFFSWDLSHLFECLVSNNYCYYHVNPLLWAHNVLCFQNMLLTFSYIHLFLH